MSEVQETNTSEDTTDSAFTEATETAAKEFTKLAPEVRGRIKAMASKSGKGLARVMIAATEFPFATSYPKFKNSGEETLFMMLLQLNGLKQVLNEAMKPQMQGIQDELVRKTVNEKMEETLNQLENKKAEAN